MTKQLILTYTYSQSVEVPTPEGWRRHVKYPGETYRWWIRHAHFRR